MPRYRLFAATGKRCSEDTVEFRQFLEEVLPILLEFAGRGIHAIWQYLHISSSHLHSTWRARSLRIAAASC